MVLSSLINMRKFIRNKIKQGNKRIYGKGIRKIDHMMEYFGVGDMGGRLGLRKYQKIRIRIKIKIKMKIRKMEMEMEMGRVKYIVI